MEDFGFYLVMTNPRVGYERCCEAAVEAGVRMVQLRMKDVPRATLLDMAKRLVPIERRRAKQPEPEIGIVGLSTHSPAQAAASVAAEPDYIGVGPVFATPTKKIPDPVLGTETAGRMVKSVPFPAVAIGGIDEGNLESVLAAGARNWAVVRAVCLADDPLAAIRRIQRLGADIIERLA